MIDSPYAHYAIDNPVFDELGYCRFQDLIFTRGYKEKLLWSDLDGHEASQFDMDLKELAHVFLDFKYNNRPLEHYYHFTNKLRKGLYALAGEVPQNKIKFKNLFVSNKQINPERCVLFCQETRYEILSPAHQRIFRIAQKHLATLFRLVTSNSRRIWNLQLFLDLYASFQVVWVNKEATQSK